MHVVSYSPAQEVSMGRFSETYMVRYNIINLIGTNRALQYSTVFADFSQDDKTYKDTHVGLFLSNISRFSCVNTWLMIGTCAKDSKVSFQGENIEIVWLYYEFVSF